MKNINRYRNWAIFKSKSGEYKIKFKNLTYNVIHNHYRDINNKYVEEIYFIDGKGNMYDLKPAIYGR